MQNQGQIALLVMDESQSVRAQIAGALKNEGFAVTETERGYQAFAIVKGQPVQIVIAGISEDTEQLPFVIVNGRWVH